MEGNNSPAIQLLFSKRIISAWIIDGRQEETKELREHAANACNYPGAGSCHVFYTSEYLCMAVGTRAAHGYLKQTTRVVFEYAGWAKMVPLWKRGAA
jgi:hypothetical protein